MTRRIRLLLPFLAALLLPSAVLGQSAWQQHVHYEMDVTLLADRHQMVGTQMLRYVNNSPDTLDRVYYHLYFNAFQPHSMMAERNRTLPDADPRIVPRIFNLGPEEIGYHHVTSLTQNGTPVAFSVFDTIMEVELAEPIPPGGIALFAMRFRSQVPLQTRRSGRDNAEGIDYSMSQWYPKMANYDERGWHTDPYVGREFYAPFGSFDVRITLPSEYVIGSTGVLQNPEEIGHGYAEGVDRSDADSLTWHFQAENIHDFAWAADPDYIHDVVESDSGATIHLLYQPGVARTWERQREWMPEILAFYGREYGPYLYPQMTVAQAGDGGMEYPMITFVTGRRPPPSLLGVSAHETAHMWFYGMMGSNEADHAWMDEGFASYATTEVVSHIQDNPDPAHTGAYLGVLQARHFGLYERLNTPSDWFQSNFGYSIAAYSGGEMLLDMLGYVISDSLRDRFLHEYHYRFALDHPDPYDVEKIAEDVSGIRLDWYFEQFGNETWELDYEVERLHSTREADGWRTRITLERDAPAAMPVDLLLRMADGTTRWVNIPLSIMQGRKPVPEGWIEAEPWAWTAPLYTLDLVLPEKVVEAEIDPLLRTLESTRLNNASDLPLRARFMQPPSQRWDTYEIGWRPLALYAHNWGAAGGLQARGQYLFGQWATRATLQLWPEILFSGGRDPVVDPDGFLGGGIAQRSAMDGIDFDVSLSNSFASGPYVSWTLRSRKHLGVLQNDAQTTLLLTPTGLLTGRRQELTLGVRHQHRTSDRSFFNVVSGGFIPEAMLSAHARLALSGSRHRYLLAGETGGALKDQGEPRTANRAWMDLAWGIPVGPFTGSLRVFAGAGDSRLARHKRFRLGGASFEDRWSDAAYRSVGAAFEDPLEEAHWVAFQMPGPVAYLRDASDLTDEVLGAVGYPHAATASLRLLTPPAGRAPLLRPLQFEAFFGIGQVWAGGWLSDLAPDDFLMDAGLAVRYALPQLAWLSRWTAQSDVLSGLTLTARFPFWASDPARTDHDEPVAFRWLLGVEMDDLPWH